MRPDSMECDAQKAACSYYDQCVRAGRSRDFDELCPIYKDRLDLYDGYYRTSLWESVAFYNYIQHFLPEAVEFTYARHKEDMDADFTAFSQALYELKPLSRGDVMLIWIDEEVSWSLILFQRVFDCMKSCGWKMLVLMKTEQSRQYYQAFKSSRMVNSVHETQDSSDIKNASKASRLGKNILPYDAIQTMLHTEIKNIEQRIHNQKTKSGIKRKSRKF